jgi:SAM-dependent methyltransferase
MTAAEDLRRNAPSALRNREPILDVLRRMLPPHGTVLEIASGTGQHTAFFAAAFPGLTFQPSDLDPEARASIAAWGAPLQNVRPPLAIDVTAERWKITRADAVLCINMIHIAPWEACEGLMRGVAHLLPPGGILYLYGPYRLDGRHTAPSNAAFDQSLRMQNPAWGVRDLEAVVAEADRHGLVLLERVPMPANNQSVVLRRS